MTKQVLIKYLNPRKIALIILGSILQAIAINIFIANADLYSGGVVGVALFFTTILAKININLGIGTVFFILNLPLLFLAWFKLGKRFSFYTILAVVSFSIIAKFVPTNIAVSENVLLITIFGGILMGVAITLVLKAGGSTGGIDIISMYLSERSGRPMGAYAISINIVVFSLVAIVASFEVVLYSIINAYICAIVIDKLHTRYRKLTLLVNTRMAKEVIEEYHNKSTRGVTIIPAVGAYTKEPQDILYFVISSYELSPTLELIKRIDANAFININKTERVFGNFKQIDLDEI